MKKYFLFLAFFLVLASSASAVVNDTLVVSNCETLGLQPEVCGAVYKASKEGGWTPEEEKQMLLLLFSQGGIEQMHSTVKNWNTNLKMGDTAPQGGESSYSSAYVSNAWVRAFTAMPSFIESGKLFINSFGNAHAGYYYELKVPGSMGKNENGTSCVCDSDDLYGIDYDDDGDDDYCRVDYYYIDYSKARVKMNSQVISEINASSEYGKIRKSLGKFWKNWLVPYANATAQNTFSAELDIISEVHERTFDWDSAGSCTSYCYCCDDDGCEKCGHKDKYICRLDDDDVIATERKTMAHTLGSTAYNYTAPAENHSVVFSNLNTVPKGVLTSNAMDYELNVEKGMIGKSQSSYSFEMSYYPYNIFTIVKGKGNASFYTSGVFVDSGQGSTVEFRAPGYDGTCYFSYIYPFGRKVTECNLFEKASTTLRVTTEKSLYGINETVNVKVDFDAEDAGSKAEIMVTYGDKSKMVTTSSGGSATAKFDAQQGGHSITAYFSGDDKRSPASTPGLSIFATDRGMEYYLQAAMLGFAVYGLVFFYRKYSEVIAG